LSTRILEKKLYVITVLYIALWSPRFTCCWCVWYRGNIPYTRTSYLGLYISLKLGSMESN